MRFVLDSPDKRPDRCGGQMANACKRRSMASLPAPDARSVAIVCGPYGDGEWRPVRARQLGADGHAATREQQVKRLDPVLDGDLLPVLLGQSALEGDMR